MKRKWILFSTMMISMAFLSGCWSKKELSELALISAVGIDRDEDGNYMKAIQIINPGNVSSGLQGGGGGQAPGVTVITAEGKSIVDVHINASAEISRQLYHPHANLIVIGEDLAREQPLNTLLDSFDRNAEFRNTAQLVIAKKSPAADLIKVLSPVEKLPSEKIYKTLDVTEKMRGENITVSLQDFIKTSASPGIEPVLSSFTLEGDVKEGKKQENIQQSQPETIVKADGLAIFKEDKLVDFYSGNMARGVVWILDRVKQTDVLLDWKKNKDAITYSVIRQSTSVSADTSKDLPEITVNVKAEGMIRETEAPVKLDDPNVIHELEKTAEKEIKEQLERTVKQTQNKKTDIFGFGQTVYRKDADKWKKLRNNWNDDYFPNLKVKVNVDAFIRRTGLRTAPNLSEIKEKYE
ncbi:Ger(x)C family spore germination protein [Domibacillus indicus]|uniref:Ger(x)C family spore germination protein n=1 Tax=Domibacillus indicus TaxID=1437523 RepID=UPI000617F936|nr:Ger(x)C family spore germination protein [Domibacillus indicus]